MMLVRTAVISPVKERLSLPTTTRHITGMTRLFNLSNMPRHVFPSLDLSRVLFWYSAAHVIAAIPLEPAPWIFLVYPAFSLPFCPTLARVNFKKVHPWIMHRTHTGSRKPFYRELIVFSLKVMPTKYTQLQHLLRSEVRLKLRIEVLAYRLGQCIGVVL